MTDGREPIDPAAVLQDDALLDALSRRAAPAGALSDPAARLLADLASALDEVPVPVAGPAPARGPHRLVLRPVVAVAAAACAAVVVAAALAAPQFGRPPVATPALASASTGNTSTAPSAASRWIEEAEALLAPADVGAADLERAGVLLSRAQQAVRAEELRNGASPDREALDAARRLLTRRLRQRTPRPAAGLVSQPPLGTGTRPTSGERQDDGAPDGPTGKDAAAADHEQPDGGGVGTSTDDDAASVQPAPGAWTTTTRAHDGADDGTDDGTGGDDHKDSGVDQGDRASPPAPGGGD